MNRFLSLDLGTTTGYAFYDGKKITSGSVDFSTKRFEGGGMRGLRFKRWLEQANTQFGPIEAVYFEEVRRHSGTLAAHVYGGLMMCLTTWCEENNTPYQSVPIGDIKRFATGNGAADKPAMIAAARLKGHSPVDDNEADAIAISYLMLHELTQ